MAEPLRVLLISGEYPPMEGGVADFTRILGEELARQGAEVHVLTARRGAGEGQGAVQVYPWLDSWSFRPLYGAVRRLLRILRPAVINIQYQAAAYGLHPAINLLPWVVPTPVVATFHDLLVPYLFPKAGPLRWGANLALARGAAAVIVTNAQDRERLAGYPWLKRLEQIPIGSNIPYALPADYEREAWRARWGIPPEALVLCYFGFLNASKGGEDLIAALDALHRAGYNVYLLMIGGAVGASDPTNREYLARVRAAIAGRGLDRRVIWTGHLPPAEVSASLCSADLCVLPYRDGASFRRGSFMAALAHGLAIVTTQPQVSLPELIHGENVWLVPPADPEALAAALIRLAHDAPLRGHLGAGARALAQEFAWERIAARTLEVYRAVAQR